MSRVYVTLSGYIVVNADREKSIGIRRVGRSQDEMIWLPRSQVQDGQDIDLGETDLSVAEWLAEERGLEY